MPALRKANPTTSEYSDEPHARSVQTSGLLEVLEQSKVQFRQRRKTRRLPRCQTATTDSPTCGRSLCKRRRLLRRATSRDSTDTRHSSSEEAFESRRSEKYQAATPTPRRPIESRSRRELLRLQPIRASAAPIQGVPRLLSSTVKLSDQEDDRRKLIHRGSSPTDHSRKVLTQKIRRMFRSRCRSCKCRTEAKIPVDGTPLLFRGSTDRTNCRLRRAAEIRWGSSDLSRD